MTTTMETHTRAEAIPSWGVLDPHCPEQRYRIYRLRDGEQTCLCATPTAEGIGPAIIDQRELGLLSDTDAVGVLDARGEREDNPLDELGNYTLPGAWLISPYNTGTANTGRR